MLPRVPRETAHWLAQERVQAHEALAAVRMDGNCSLGSCEDGWELQAQVFS